MSFYPFLCGSAVMIILLSNGCHSEQQPACGRATNKPRIVRGQNAAAGSWPWIASIQVNGKRRCGGSLISDMWVLTAATCIMYYPDNMTVVLGLESMSGPNLNNVSKAIDKIIVHPMFKFFIDNNMALLKLSSPVNFTDYIQPVCLASANSTFYTGVSSWVVGFGDISSGGPYADTLQEVRVPVVGNNECKCDHPYYDLTDNMICAGFTSGGNGSCWRDPGGPMMIKKGSVWVQSGVVIYAICAMSNIPQLYARVSQYEDWIKNHTGSSKPGFVDYMSQGVDSDLDFVCPTAYSTTQHPYSTTQNPDATTQHPYSTTQHPDTTTQHPYSTTQHPDATTQHPDPTTQHPHTTNDGSVFGSGESVISSLGLLLMSLYVLVGDI